MQTKGCLNCSINSRKQEIYELEGRNNELNEEIAILEKSICINDNQTKINLDADQEVRMDLASLLCQTRSLESLSFLTTELESDITICVVDNMPKAGSQISNCKYRENDHTNMSACLNDDMADIQVKQVSMRYMAQIQNQIQCSNVSFGQDFAQTVGYEINNNSFNSESKFESKGTPDLTFAAGLSFLWLLSVIKYMKKKVQDPHNRAMLSLNYGKFII